MSTSVVTLRVPDEVLTRIDHNAKQSGETRTDRMLRWLPEYYDGPSCADPPDEHIKAASTTSVPLRVDNNVLERLDATVLRTGLTRTDVILRWQPEYYDRNTAQAAYDDATSLR